MFNYKLHPVVKIETNAATQRENSTDCSFSGFFFLVWIGFLSLIHTCEFLTILDNVIAKCKQVHECTQMKAPLTCCLIGSLLAIN